MQEFMGVDGHLVPLHDTREQLAAHTKAWDTGSGRQLDLRLPAAYDGEQLKAQSSEINVGWSTRECRTG
jgi:hypothetical protein